MRSTVNPVKINQIRAAHHPFKWAWSSLSFLLLNPLYHQIFHSVRGDEGHVMGEKVAFGIPEARGHPGALIFRQAGAPMTTGRAFLPLNLHQRVRRQRPPEEEEEKSWLNQREY